jgi:hypothetical protein
MAIKTGATVRLIQPEIKGTVKQRRINEGTDEVEVLVEWEEGGQPVQRWLDATQVEEVQP